MNRLFLDIQRLLGRKNRTLLFTPCNGYFCLYKTSLEKSSLALSYLQKSCGLSLESAILASKRLRFDSIENPDKVLNLLRAHGLSHAHIKSLVTLSPGLLLADLESTLKPNLDLFVSLGITSNLLSEMLLKHPGVLEANVKAVVDFFREFGFSDARILLLTKKKPALYICDLEKTLKPKLEFLKSLGLRQEEIASLVSSQPYILSRSLENHIIPRIKVLRDALGNDEDVLKAIKRYFPILEYNWEKVLVPCISFLLNQGVPESFIWKIFLINPKPLTLGTVRLSQIVDEVKKLGFDPTTYKFMLAIRAMAAMSTARWEEKLNAFRSFNLSEKEVCAAINKQPLCMLPSEKKLRQVMGFLTNKLNVKSSLIAENPDVLLLSLDKRIMPRCLVLQILKSKDLKSDFPLFNVLRLPEEKFIEKIIKKYQGEAPEIVKAHQGKGESQGSLSGF